MSSSDKLRLAGQQPSARGGVLRMTTWRCPIGRRKRVADRKAA